MRLLFEKLQAWDDALHDHSEEDRSLAFWHQCVESCDELVADPRDYLEGNTLGVLEAWATFEAAACVLAARCSLAWEASYQDGYSGSGLGAV